MGFNLYGFERCRLEEGCPVDQTPRPVLSALDQAAWIIFRACQTQWDVAVGMGGAIRTGMKYDQAKVVAETHGFVFNRPLLQRLQRLEALSILDESKRVRRAPGSSEGEGDMVN